MSSFIGTRWLALLARVGRIAAVIALAGFWSGCGRDDIRVYRVPKEKERPSTSMAAQEGDPHAGVEGMGMPAVPKITFGAVPAGWQEVPAGKMRAASFMISGKDDRHADLAVIPLPGITGREGDIVNLWRDQLKLTPLSSEEVGKLGEAIEVDGSKASIFEMASTEPVFEEKYKERILVAMFTRGNTSWFFKITGEDELVHSQRDAFLSFLKTVKIGDSAPIPPMAPAPSLGSPTTSGGRPKWELPSHWREGTASPMTLAKFTAGDPAGGQADVSVSVMGGTAGGVLANVNRWRGQLGLAPVSEAQVGKLASPLGDKWPGALLVDMAAEAPKPGQTSRTRLIAAMIPKSDQTWFYKMMGDETAVVRERDIFIKFVQTVQYNEP